MKKIFLAFVNYFTLILSATVIVVAVFLPHNRNILSENILWQIILAAVLTSIPSTVLPFLELRTSRAVAVCWTVHFMIVYIITAALLKTFGWFELSFKNLALTFLAIAFIFFFTAGMHYYTDKKNTSLINNELQKRFGKDSDEK
ncbi:MAG: DUF3021 family protein [Oscillospiraceae bacterium]|nr:DUF3021 family protein [Oscillospiraceae bacterium]